MGQPLEKCAEIRSDSKLFLPTTSILILIGCSLTQATFSFFLKLKAENVLNLKRKNIRNNEKCPGGARWLFQKSKRPLFSRLKKIKKFSFTWHPHQKTASIKPQDLEFSKNDVFHLKNPLRNLVFCLILKWFSNKMFFFQTWFSWSRGFLWWIYTDDFCMGNNDFSKKSVQKSIEKWRNIHP